jgi:D-alanyl-D-alanine carboxypeptidase
MKSVDEQLQAIVDRGVPGAIALAVAPGGRWEGAAGLADVETGARMTTAHRFPIASVTKTFVAAVVLRLVAEGQLELDAPAGEHGATVRQLLNHTSGLPDAWDIDELLEPYRRDLAYRPARARGERAALALARPRLFAAGEGWSYSGSNYAVLGLLVEEVTGSTLKHELALRILEPLGLTATELPDSLPDDVARAYLPPENPVLPGPGPGLVDVTHVLFSGDAGGGMVSTAADVARFLRALLAGEVLPSELQAELLRTVASDWDESEGYGLGIEEITSIGGETSPCGRAWGHLGFTLGHTTIALSSESGDRQAVALFTTHPLDEETWNAMARIAWACYCGNTT